ncbi:adenosylmethionine decarboxylase [Paraferrimonas sedimenticola]|uniref:S-adenosylmethionine decarboxylase SpeD n=1 Tax=Paraferrimonas sedimenticola TaxID=375674 RepID=A0AA37W1X8_9GAMM|nr:adenosylmethionine decarboxylase [Paraferrimonas sedimenticola]GLP97183.1 S-adenosylmethionine decarboxylase SpeD [Paraferrimonas sedimenticola]
MFFEGSEKKVQIRVTPQAGSLRELGIEFWRALVAQSQASILSQVQSAELDAFILSESSLFVWDDRFVMITCGNISLVDSIGFFLQRFDRELLAEVSFQRKNEYQSHLQKTTFEQDQQQLSQWLPGRAHQLGHLDGHHNFIWYWHAGHQPKALDINTELLMYHISGEAADYLRSQGQSIAGVRRALALEDLFAGFIIDDFLFEPYGYSVNGVKGCQYFTIHITPQEDSSYVSFETNIDLALNHPTLLDQLCQILNPSSFDLITFNCSPSLTASDDTVLVAHQSASLQAVYPVDFKHFMCPLGT